MKILTSITMISVFVIVFGLVLLGPAGEVGTTSSNEQITALVGPSPLQAQPRATPNPARQAVDAIPAAQSAPTPVMVEATPSPQGQATSQQADGPLSSFLIFIAGGAIIMALGILYKISSKTTFESRQTAVMEA